MSPDFGSNCRESHDLNEIQLDPLKRDSRRPSSSERPLCRPREAADLPAVNGTITTHSRHVSNTNKRAATTNPGIQCTTTSEEHTNETNLLETAVTNGGRSHQQLQKK